MAVGIKIAHDFNQFQQVNIVYALHFIYMLYTAETTKRAKNIAIHCTNMNAFVLVWTLLVETDKRHTHTWRCAHSGKERRKNNQSICK